jgi:hypothetical protein
MTQEVKVFQIGADYEGRYSPLVGQNGYEPYEKQGIHDYSDLSLQRSTTKNMDKLWERFHRTGSYPEYYLGVSKKMAICKCPNTGKEEWFNGERCISVKNPKKGSTVTVTIEIKGKIYMRNFVFMGWTDVQVHEWAMTKGTTLQLTHSFVEGLCAQDKRYLKMNR